MSAKPAIELKPAYLPGSAGDLFTLHYRPAQRVPVGGILYLHAYGEEMHKSRRMAALQARRFASAGWMVLQYDHFGSGDSAGDAGDARWDIWIEDAERMLDALRSHGRGPILLWGLRLGASMAAELSTRCDDIHGLLLWQPVINGERYLNHLLRLKLAAEMLLRNPAGETTQTLRERLASGEAVEIAGNRLDPGLAQAIDQIRLLSIRPRAPTAVLEIRRQTEDELSPSVQQLLQSWGERTAATGKVVDCAEFWQTQEIEVCPRLLDATVASAGTLANPCPTSTGRL